MPASSYAVKGGKNFKFKSFTCWYVHKYCTSTYLKNLVSDLGSDWLDTILYTILNARFACLDLEFLIENHL